MRSLTYSMGMSLDGYIVGPPCFPEWDLIGNVITHGLYPRRTQEHMIPIERIPDRPVAMSYCVPPGIARPCHAALSKRSNSRQEVVAWPTFVAGGPADEIRTKPEQDERALGTPRPGLEAAFGSKAAGRSWLEGRRWRDEALASPRAHPTRLTLAVVIC